MESDNILDPDYYSLGDLATLSPTAAQMRTAAAVSRSYYAKQQQAYATTGASTFPDPDYKTTISGKVVIGDQEFDAHTLGQLLKILLKAHPELNI